MDVVIRTPHGEAEVTIARAEHATAIADIVERVTGSMSPPTADVDGRALLTTDTIDASGMTTGSVIDLGPPARSVPHDALIELVQVAGWGAGSRQSLGPGTYRVGPGRRVNAVDLDLAHVDKIAFEVAIDEDGSAVVTVDDRVVRVDGVRIERSTPWTTGILDVAGRAFVLNRRGDPVRPPPQPPTRAGEEPSGTVVFNRPPRRSRPSAPPPLVLPDRLDATHEVRRSARGSRHQPDSGSEPRPPEGVRAEIVARRDAERARRHDLFPHVATAMHIALSASSQLWATRPDDDEGFEVPIGLGDVEWRPELSGDAAMTASVESTLADLGPLPTVPVTIDLRGERGVAFVGSSEFTRAALRGVLVEACVQHGPADLDVVILTNAARAPVWEWVKWLPHSRPSGATQVLVALDQVDAWAAAITNGPDFATRPDHLTLAVVDEPAWWRDRAAPVRAAMNDPTRPVRFIVLAESSSDVPSVCTTVVTEQPHDLARVEQMGDRTVIDDVQLFLLATADAAATARRLAPLDDPDLPEPAVSALPVSVPLAQLLGPANIDAPALAAHWRTTSERSGAAVPIGVTHLGALEIDLERDGPHVLIGGAAGAGKSELLRTLVMGLAARLPPAAITFALLDLAGRSTFAACASLPHVVMHHDDTDAHLTERALRCLRAELLGRDEKAWRGLTLPRLVVVVDEPIAVVTEHPHLVSSLLEIASDGQRLGVHLVVATQHPATVLDVADAPEIGLRIALRLSDERESEHMIGSGVAAKIPRRTPGRGLVRLGDADPVELQAATVSASSSHAEGHDLELRPYVVGRELTPMELRVMRGSNGSAGGGGPRPGFENDLARLVDEVTGAAVAMQQVRHAPLCAEPLPDVLDGRGLISELPGTGVPLGLVDMPDRQTQQIRWWEPGAGGSLLIYGSERAGASSALVSMAMGVAERYPADDCHLYVIDAGAFGPLDALPHTGAVVRNDDTARLVHLVRLLVDEVDVRTAAAAGSLHPHLVVMIDDVGALSRHLRHDDEHEPPREDLPEAEEVWAGILRIVRHGPAVGICTVATATCERDVPGAFAAQIASRLVMRLADPSGYASFGFQPINVPRFVPGRALDPADRAELQLVAPPATLAGAVAALAAEPARFHPPRTIDEPPS